MRLLLTAVFMLGLCCPSLAQERSSKVQVSPLSAMPGLRFTPLDVTRVTSGCGPLNCCASAQCRKKYRSETIRQTGGCAICGAY